MTTVRVLGPIDALVDGETVPLGGPRQRRVVVALAIAEHRVLDEADLMAAIWDSEADLPDSPRNTIQQYVSRLRGILGAEAIESVGAGYRLAETIETDAEMFSRQVGEAQALRSRGDDAAAHDVASHALGHWRGEAFGDLRAIPVAQATAARLDEMRMATRVLELELGLAIGDALRVVADAEAMAREHPENEEPVRILAEARAAAGQTAEALRTIADFRQRLADRTGLEPSVSLASLEARLLDGEAIPVTATRQLRGYELDELIGEGAFGAIYRATQPAVGREVAIKVVRAEFANDPRFIRRFEVEAQTVARLEHPHIVPLHDYWREPGGAYLVMRYLRGGSAEQRLVADGPFSLAATSVLVDEIGGALAVAHGAGVVHRDVKPANILFDDNGNSYLADFGIAIASGAHADLDLRSAGSPLYVSPEQVRDGEISPASDIYAFGVALYELLTANAPFASSTSVKELLERKLRESVPLVSDVRSDVPRAVDLVLQQATNPQPGERFVDVGEMVLAFRAAVGGLPASAVSTGNVSADRPRSVASQTLLSIERQSANPYKGLSAFQEGDTPDFFGRDQLVDRLVEHLAGSRFLAVVGPSGSGKSSVVRAGLIPRMRGERTYVAQIIPGPRPMHELETALLRLSPEALPSLLEQLNADEHGLGRAIRRVLPGEDDELLLIVDQLEELFTVTGAGERERFLCALAALAADERSRVRVVVTLRADFYDRPLASPVIGDLVEANTIAVTPLVSDDLERAIAGPAERVGVRVEPALVSELTAHGANSPGVLPLMQFVLTETYERRSNGAMTLDAYRELGGISGAIAARADQLFTDASPAEREQIRRLFSRLVTPGEGTEDTRRRAAITELATVDAAIIDRYGAARLLEFDRNPDTRVPTVEVAHEALIREWPRLRSWLDDDRDGLRLHRHLGTSAAAWEASGRDDGELYRGGRLEAAEEWATDHTEDLNQAEAAFLAASSDERDRAVAAEQRSRRRLRRLLAGVAVVAAIALVAGAVAFQQRGRANDEAAEARAQTVLVAEREAETADALEVAEAERAVAEEQRAIAERTAFAAETARLQAEAARLAATDRRLALQLAAEAYRREPTAASLGALQRTLVGAGPLLATYGAGITFTGVHYVGADRIVGAGPDALYLYDAETGELLRSWPVADLATWSSVSGIQRGALAVSRNGLIAAGTTGGQVLLVDPDADRPIGVLPHDAAVLGLAFGPDDALATADANGIVRLWDPAARDLHIEFAAHPYPTAGDIPLPPDAYIFPESLEQANPIGGIAFDQTGTRLVTADFYTAAIWDTGNGDLLQRHAITVPAPSISPTGYATLAVRDVLQPDSSTAWISVGRELDGFDLQTGEMTRIPLTAVSLTAFAETVRVGNRVVAVDSGTVVSIDLESGATTAVGLTQTQDVNHLSASADASRVLIATESGIQSWSLDGSGALHRVAPRSPGHTTATVSADGRTVLVDGGFNANALPRLWDLAGGRATERSHPFESFTFAKIDAAETIFHFPLRVVQFLDAATLEPLGPGVQTDGALDWHVAPDRARHTLGHSDGTLALYEMDTGRLVTRFGPPDGEQPTPIRTHSVDWDTDRVVGVREDGTALIWDLDSGDVIDTLAIADTPVGLASFSRWGGILVALTIDGRYHFLDPLTLSEIREPIAGPPELVPVNTAWAFRFSPDERYLLSLTDGAVRLWDLESGSQVGGPLPGDPAFASSTGNESSVFRATTADTDRVYVWELDPDAWPALACRVAGGGMSPEEWTAIGPRGTGWVDTCVSLQE